MNFLRKIFSTNSHASGTKTHAVESNIQTEKPDIFLDSIELTEGIFEPKIIGHVKLDTIASKIETLRDFIANNQIDGLTLGEVNFFPSSSDEIAAFEQKYEVTLPKDFKAFLGEVGYDIFPYYEPKNTPYKLTELYGINAEPISPQPDWYINADKQVLRISDYGCGIYFVLSLFGNECGNVWTHDQANTGTACPVIPKNEGLDRVRFVEWYNYWLDAVLAEIDREL